MEIHIRYKLLDVDGTEVAQFDLIEYLVLWGMPKVGSILPLKVNGVERTAVITHSDHQQVADNFWSVQAAAQLETI
jgi:putative SOS response-associated peptidase YedK